MQKLTASAASSMLATTVFCQVFTLPHVVADVRAPHDVLWETEAIGLPPQRLFDPPPEEVNLLQKNLDVDSHMANVNRSSFDLLAADTDEEEEKQESSTNLENHFDNGSIFEEESTEQEGSKDEVAYDGCQSAAWVRLKGGRSGNFCLLPGAGSIIKCSQDAGGLASMFVMLYCREGKVAFKNIGFGKFCIDTQEGIKCNQERISTNGIFKPEPQEKSDNPTEMKLAFKGQRSHQYCAEEEAGVICDRDWVKGWEVFTMTIKKWVNGHR